MTTHGATPELDRREFLRVMGASLALGGLAGCTPADREFVVGYHERPERIVPGRPRFFATAMPMPGGGLPLLAESHMGRPVKVEGNAGHPASGGATDVFAQASVLSLYDPDRSRVLTHRGELASWDAFLVRLRDALAREEPRGGAGFAILAEPVLSPSLAHWIRKVRERWPESRLFTHDPLADENAREGARLAFGRPLVAAPRLDAARVVLSFDDDFLLASPARVRNAREWIARRDPGGPSRLYVAESALTITGGMADHRFAMRSSEISAFARSVAAALGVKGVGPGEGARATAVAGDLRSAGSAALVLAGRTQPPPVHALAHAMNAALGSLGETVVLHEPPEEEAGEPLDALVDAMNAGEVELLLVLDANAAHTAPHFADALERVRLKAHLGLYEDETAALCDWHVPARHYLESWGDVRPPSGDVAMIQPLIEPLFGGRGPHELLAAVLGETATDLREAVREYWRTQAPADEFERVWRRALHDGFWPGTAREPVEASPRSGIDFSGEAGPRDGFDVVLRPDPTLWDGRYANNAWLQETPAPFTKIVWTDVVHMAPATADSLDVRDGDLVEVEANGRSVRGPAWRVPGHAEGAVTLHLGRGRTRVGGVGDGTGFSAYALDARGPLLTGARVRKAGGRRAVVTTQGHHTMAGRDLARSTTVARGLAVDPNRGGRSLYPEWPESEYEWGMAIDLNACIGCNACVVACQAENNVPVVGERECGVGREMHWLRIDTYFSGEETIHQPLLCMHCENAPCEVVCPVAATVHSDEGLNDMVYNRCVGTRYCSNNCPYKVRRFNYFEYARAGDAVEAMRANPDVTVRMRGVMEKCTYCVQRIEAARIDAEKEGRPIRDGEIVTACQQACPTRAIVFGDITDPDSAVSRRKATPRDYSLLGELNTKPRTTYQARVRNPNGRLG